ncbi:uncharacterized protein ACO6RY_08161 [Pungitius sinensis]
MVMKRDRAYPTPPRPSPPPPPPPPLPACSLVLYDLLCLGQGCGLCQARPDKKRSKPLLLRTHISLAPNLPLRLQLVHQTAFIWDFHEINPQAVFGYTGSLRLFRTFERDVSDPGGLK